MKNYIILVLFVGVLVAGCSPEKRLQRLLRHHPELMQTHSDTTSDTMVYVHEIYIPGDTIEIHNSDTIVDTEYQTLYVDRDKIVSIVKPDTFIRVDTVIRFKYVTTTITAPCVHEGEVLMDERVAFILYILSAIGILWWFNRVVTRKTDI